MCLCNNILVSTRDNIQRAFQPWGFIGEFMSTGVSAGTTLFELSLVSGRLQAANRFVLFLSVRYESECLFEGFFSIGLPGATQRTKWPQCLLCKGTTPPIYLSDRLCGIYTQWKELYTQGAKQR